MSSKPSIELKEIEEKMKSPNAKVRAEAVLSLKDLPKFPFSLIDCAAKDSNADVRVAAMKVCENKEEFICQIDDRLLHDVNYEVRLAALWAFTSLRELGTRSDILSVCLNDDYYRIRFEAMKACKGYEVPLDLIEKGLKDENYQVRVAAIRACAGRHLPREILDQLVELKEDVCQQVKSAARKACYERLL